MGGAVEGSGDLHRAHQSQHIESTLMTTHSVTLDGLSIARLSSCINQSVCVQLRQQSIVSHYYSEARKGYFGTLRGDGVREVPD